MIVVRRFFAVILAILFVALYVPILVIFRVNDTVGNPNFYVDQLRKDDIYTFVYAKALPAWLDEQAAGGSSSPVNLANYKTNVESVAQQALPKEYLQAETEAMLKTVLPYLLGDTNSFTMTIPVKERVRAAATAVKTEMHKPGVFDGLYNEIISRAAGSLSGAAQGPFAMTRTEAETTLRSVLTEDWMQAQADKAIDNIVPYLTKESDHFAINVDLASRMDLLQSIVTTNLQKQPAYDSLMAGIATTPLGQDWQTGFKLPIGMTLSAAEIKPAVQKAFPLSWYQSIIPGVVQPLFAYLKGSSNTLSASVSLADRKAALATEMAAVADAKLQAYFNSLPLATPQQVIQMAANPSQLPAARPPGMTYDQIKQLLKIDISAQVAPFVNASIPGSWTLSQTDIADIFGGRDFIAKARDTISNGYTFTDASLASFTGGGASRLDTVRNDIAAGITFNQDDLRSFLVDGNMQPQDFDSIRDTVGTARRWKMLLWVIPGLLLIGIGFLGGRHWGSRLMWAAGVLVVTAIIVLVASGPVFSSTVQPKIHEEIAKASQGATGFQQVMVQKGADMVDNAVGAFVSGIRKQGLILLVTSLVLVGVGLYWYLQGRRHPHNHT